MFTRRVLCFPVTWIAHGPIVRDRRVKRAVLARASASATIPSASSKREAVSWPSLAFFGAGTPSAEAAATQSAAAGGATEPARIDREGLVLAMVYANGEGVCSNLALARQFLCEYGSGIENDTGSEQLKKFNALMLAGKRLNMCGEEIAFGRGVAFDCLDMEQDRREAEVHRRESAILAAVSPAVREASCKLRKAWRDFHSAHGSISGRWGSRWWCVRRREFS